MEHVAFDWIDASVGGIEPSIEQMQRGGSCQNAQGLNCANAMSGADAGMDDAFFEAQLPFMFPFFGQSKSRVLISTNGNTSSRAIRQLQLLVIDRHFPTECLWLQVT